MIWHFPWWFAVPFRHGERIGFSYLISQKYTGDNSKVKVLRNSEILSFDIKLASHKRLIPSHIKGRPPSYYIVAGFVFTAVSVPYLRSEVGSLTWHHSAWYFYIFVAWIVILNLFLYLLRLICLLVYLTKSMLRNGSLGVGYSKIDIVSYYVYFIYSLCLCVISK